MGLILHIFREGKIHNLVLEADEFRKRTVYDLVIRGETVLTFNQENIVAWTQSHLPRSMKARLDASFSRMRKNLLIEQKRIKQDLEFKKMLGRLTPDFLSIDQFVTPTK